jgi:hypothetical protein
VRPFSTTAVFSGSTNRNATCRQERVSQSFLCYYSLSFKGTTPQEGYFLRVSESNMSQAFLCNYSFSFKGTTPREGYFLMVSESKMSQAFLCYYSFSFKGRVSRDGYFFRVSKSINTYDMCADGLSNFLKFIFVIFKNWHIN